MGGGGEGTPSFDGRLKMLSVLSVMCTHNTHTQRQHSWSCRVLNYVFSLNLKFVYDYHLSLVDDDVGIKPNSILLCRMICWTNWVLDVITF